MPLLRLARQPDLAVSFLPRPVLRPVVNDLPANRSLVRPALSPAPTPKYVSTAHVHALPAVIPAAAPVHVTRLPALVQKLKSSATTPVRGLAAWVSSVNTTKVRYCESHSEYGINTGNGYYGAYQMTASFWHEWGDGSAALASEATPAAQDAAAYKAWKSDGWRPWECARIVGIL